MCARAAAANSTSAASCSKEGPQAFSGHFLDHSRHRRPEWRPCCRDRGWRTRPRRGACCAARRSRSRPAGTTAASAATSCARRARRAASCSKRPTIARRSAVAAQTSPRTTGSPPRAAGATRATGSLRGPRSVKWCGLSDPHSCVPGSGARDSSGQTRRHCRSLSTRQVRFRGDPARPRPGRPSAAASPPAPYGSQTQQGAQATETREPKAAKTQQAVWCPAGRRSSSRQVVPQCRLQVLQGAVDRRAPPTSARVASQLYGWVRRARPLLQHVHCCERRRCTG